MFIATVMACYLEGSQVTDDCTISGGFLVETIEQCDSKQFYEEMYETYMQLGMMPVGHTCIEIDKGEFE